MKLLAQQRQGLGRGVAAKNAAGDIPRQHLKDPEDQRSVPHPDRPELGEELTNSFCRTDPDIAQHFARGTFTSDNRLDLPNVRARTLILQCSDDIIAGNQVGEYVRDHVPGSRLVYLAASGHCPNLSAPDEVIAAIRNII